MNPPEKGKNMNKNFLTAIFAFALILSACGSSPSDEELAKVATSAAQTVEARFTEEAENASTPIPEANATVAIEKTTSPANPPTPIPTNTDTYLIAPEGCLVANLVSETIPDGTIFKPSDYFTKRWVIQNNGECTWNQEYQLLYWGGDLMDGYTAYNFSDIALPGESIEIPIQLRAPDSPGVYTGFWKMQSRSGYIFGVGEYDAPISVNIDVKNEDDIEYGIISVDYYMTRDPEDGCPANVERTIHAIVTVNGPMEIRYRFYQRESDGGIVKQKKQWLRFTEAGTLEVSNAWKLNKCVNAKPRYVSLVILDPKTDQPIYQYPEFMFINDCPDMCP
ncbi:MAG: hypothetical protein B5M51_03545 [Anaerolinea sp. 4484_236]|nr:MAG: hypothetical protein B5M51_03545 [Anaerolinea sp. 4484_236]